MPEENSKTPVKNRQENENPGLHADSSNRLDLGLLYKNT
jgi:hypothetical protein